MTRELSINRVVVYAVGFFLVGILFPIGLTEIANVTANQSVGASAESANWDSSVVTVFTIVFPVIACIGIAIDYIKGPE